MGQNVIDIISNNKNTIIGGDLESIPKSKENSVKSNKTIPKSKENSVKSNKSNEKKIVFIKEGGNGNMEYDKHSGSEKKEIKNIKIDLNSIYKDLDDKYSDINSNISKNSNSFD